MNVAPSVEDALLDPLHTTMAYYLRFFALFWCPSVEGHLNPCHTFGLLLCCCTTLSPFGVRSMYDSISNPALRENETVLLAHLRGYTREDSGAVRNVVTSAITTMIAITSWSRQTDPAEATESHNAMTS